MKNLKFLSILIILSLVFFHASAQRKAVKEGNKLYEKGKYKDAENAYQQALSKHPEYVPGLFNLGNALFKEKNYEASRKVMENTAKQAKEAQVKAGAYYNIGNSYMQEQKWEEAVHAYKNALRVNPQDADAKYNLSYALQMLKNKKGGKSDRENKEQSKDQNQNNKENQNRQDEQDKDEGQDKNDPDKEQQDRNQDKSKDENKEDRQENRPQPQPSKLSQQQAEQLLNALSQEEKKLHENKEKGKGVPVRMDKDW